MSRSWQLDMNPELKQTILTAARQGIVDATEVVFEASQLDVPVDIGDLKRSGRTRVNGLRGEIGYSDPISVIVHENLRARHRKGRAKFLETAMNTKRDAAARAIAAAIRSVMT